MPQVQVSTEANHQRTLLDSLGIDHEDFQRFTVWALAEHLVSCLSQDKRYIDELRSRPDGMKCFRAYLTNRTRRDWSPVDVEALYARVLQSTLRHYRRPITYEDLMRLLVNSKLECKRCRKSPPEVKLHIDHILPASRGGDSKYSNLQFLCQKCNLSKSNHLERSDKPWLNFE